MGFLKFLKKPKEDKMQMPFDEDLDIPPPPPIGIGEKKGMPKFEEKPFLYEKELPIPPPMEDIDIEIPPFPKIPESGIKVPPLTKETRFSFFHKKAKPSEEIQFPKMPELKVPPLPQETEPFQEPLFSTKPKEMEVPTLPEETKLSEEMQFPKMPESEIETPSLPKEAKAFEEIKFPEMPKFTAFEEKETAKPEVKEEFKPKEPAKRAEISPLERFERSAVREEREILKRKIEKLKPIYIKLDNFREMAKSINTIKTNLRNEDEILVKLQGIKLREDSMFEKWKKGIEDIQKKVIFIDKTLFKGDNNEA